MTVFCLFPDVVDSLPDIVDSIPGFVDVYRKCKLGQYEACKGVNRIQLAVYFGIGKYVSQHSRKGTWGMSALEVISNQLRRELPGLRGYSATSLRNMRKFYENWIMLDGNSASALAELQNTDNQRDIKSASTLAKNSTTAIADISSVATDERNVTRCQARCDIIYIIIYIN